MFAEFDRLDALMSVWRAGSDVLRMNAAAGERAVPVSPDVREALRTARQISEWTGGKFDVTFGALADVWKFDHDQDNTIPDARRRFRARLPLIDYRQIEIDDDAGTVFLKRKGMRVHLGGIGKGYAVERAVAILRRRGPARLHDPGGRRSLRRRAEATAGRGGSASTIRAGRPAAASRRST